ncbi:hypothetical protein O3M35_007013 [Rhynocoris fuscipes]|uniref:Attacin C-terminal domain-containing protein n=1 Tax=Rhynocoris fuscipes TaxID=488301 RepID=A0AAW1DN61_9HEMI
MYIFPISQSEDTIYRHRRSPQGKFGFTAENNNGNNLLRGDVKQTLLSGTHGQLDGNAYYQRNFGPAPAPRYESGVGLNYNHNSGAFASAQYDKVPNVGHFGAKAGYNFINDGRTSLGVGASYDRVYTPVGPTKPNVGGFLNFRHNF